MTQHTFQLHIRYHISPTLHAVYTKYVAQCISHLRVHTLGPDI